MSEPLKVLDLFSGIGGFSLGLERTGGFKTVAFCEIEEFPRRVLTKHWPQVPIYDDVRALTAARLQADGIVPDVICGGFPCQDISLAGTGAGLAGDRSGLWFEYHRLIEEIRPAWAIVENVPALRSRGLDAVLRGLAEIGYDAEWDCIPASAIGAPHRRDRVWLAAYRHTDDGGQSARAVDDEASGLPCALAHANGDAGLKWRSGDAAEVEGGRQPHRGSVSAHELADSARLQSGREEQRPVGQRTGQGGQSLSVTDADRLPTRRLAISWGECGQWIAEPDVGRVAHGVPARVDRLRGLGNAVVPQIPEIIGRAIMAAEAA